MISPLPEMDSGLNYAYAHSLFAYPSLVDRRPRLSINVESTEPEV